MKRQEPPMVPTTPDQQNPPTPSQKFSTPNRRQSTVSQMNQSINIQTTNTKADRGEEESIFS